ncbi:MAG: hypothetical protein AWU54_2188 [Candidatus Frackibacter sp. T328-2]|jgi:hypothetical protein|nr:MAG: hypothetical protein AWU54_2188 [Candidatus Frackibacter sp. T328-2]SHN09627.1 hypothetical protein SAMN04515650_12210 [Halanaerobium congolense]
MAHFKERVFKMDRRTESTINVGRGVRVITGQR